MPKSLEYCGLNERHAPGNPNNLQYHNLVLNRFTAAFIFIIISSFLFFPFKYFFSKQNGIFSQLIHLIQKQLLQLYILFVSNIFCSSNSISIFHYFVSNPKRK